MWVDCVRAKNAKVIKASQDETRTSIQKHIKFPAKPFNGLLKSKLPATKLSAQVIRIPYDAMDFFIGKYLECLKEVDSTFVIYDEEIVLSMLYSKSPELFEVF